MNPLESWKALGITLIVLFVIGLINDKSQRIAIWAAVIIGIVLILKKMRG